MKRSLPLSFARLLRSLLQSELNYADFNSTSSRKILEQFVTDNALEIRLIGKQKRKVFCPSTINLEQYLHNKFEIPSLERYIAFLESDEFKRSDAVFAASNSKVRRTTVFTGFLINCYEELSCELYNAPFLLKPLSGAFTFISAYKTFVIPPGVTVVVIENHENFREIDRQRHLFAGIRPLFVWRYQNSNAIATWLKGIPNNYINFGDFDLKGIHIFLSEFKSKIPGSRGRFFIPTDIEIQLQRHGERALYDKQRAILSNLRKHHEPELSALVNLILKYKKGLAQEILIGRLHIS